MFLLLTQIRGEVHKLFCRRRTHLGFVAFLVFELVLLLLLQRDDVRNLLRRTIERTGHSFAENFTGLTIANYLLSHTVTLLGSFYLAMIGGDIVAQEVEEGTIRMVFARRVSRARFLFGKVVACAVYTATLCVFIAMSSLALAIAFEGAGNLFVVSVDQRAAATYDFWNGLLVYCFGALPLIMLSMFTVASVAFMLSCCNVKPVAATVGTLSFFLFDQLLYELPFLAPIRGWLLTTRLSSWCYIYIPQVPATHLWISYSILAAVDALAIAIGCWRFSRRDFKP